MTYQPQEQSINSLTFEQIYIGQSFEIAHLITLNDIKSFALLTGDYNPLHVDLDFAKTTLFGKQVVHGMLTASFISTIIGMHIPGPGALWTSQTLNFLHPTYIGDLITVSAKVKAKSHATRMIAIEIEIYNQNKTKLISGESTVRMLDVPQKKRIPFEMMNNENLPDSKVILITGGSRGIGAATAKLLASQGHSIVINYIHSEYEANKLTQEIQENHGKAIAIKGDVAIESDVANIFKLTESTYGAINAVVHCASPMPIPQTFEEIEWKTFENHFDVQIKGAYHCAKYALPKMKLVADGAFVFVSSVFAEGVPPSQQTPYVTVKAALSAMARSLAVEYGPKGIRVNVVSPGLTQTEMIANIPDKVKILTKMNTPLRRLADVDDVAETINFLISRAARHITGENIRVCGGEIM